MIEHIDSGLGMADFNKIDSDLGIAKFRIVGFESQSIGLGARTQPRCFFSFFMFLMLGCFFVQKNTILNRF